MFLVSDHAGRSPARRRWHAPAKAVRRGGPMPHVCHWSGSPWRPDRCWGRSGC